MTRDFIEALLRTALQMIGMFLAARYGVGEEDWLQITGGVMAAFGVTWMLWARWGTKKVPTR